LGSHGADWKLRNPRAFAFRVTWKHVIEAGIAVSRRAAEGWALMSMICGILLGVGSRFVN
jgi:hypothetical protein